MLNLFQLMVFLAVAQLAVSWPEEQELEGQPIERLLEKLAETKKTSSGSGPLSIVGFPTEQSTTHGSDTSGKAVDGSNKRCSHTRGKENDPWWRVDLEGVHCISKVTILNRKGSVSDRLAGAVVRGGLSKDVTDNVACGAPVTSSEAATKGGTIHRQCVKPLLARYISVDIPRNTVLQLCEVTVQKVPIEQCLVSGPLSIVGFPTDQSTTHYERASPRDFVFSSDRAVDGHNEVCSITESDSNDPWWRVDLEGVHCIRKVTIFNRKRRDNFLRITNAVVRAGTSEVLEDNPACGSHVTAAQAGLQSVTIHCDKPLRARFVSVDIPGRAMLELCEIMVEEVMVEEALPGIC